MRFIDDLSELRVDAETIERFPGSVAWDKCVLPICEDDMSVYVILPADADFEDTMEELRFILNRPVVADVASRSSLEQTLKQYYPTRPQ